MTEQAEKESRLRELMVERGLDAVALRRASSFAWATGGASSYINTATDVGEGTLLYTPDRRYLIANNIEAPRLQIEERLQGQGWESVVDPWYEEADDAVVLRLTQGLRVGADWALPGAADISDDMAQLRARLLPEEGARFRELGRICAEAMDAAIRQVRPGQTEHEIAALLAGETEARGAWPIVDLVATDERVYKYRHPLPTDKAMERYAMLVLCGRKWGLVCSITRLVHFGALPAELERKQEAVARIDAAFIAATKPGARLSNVFARAVETYAATGFPDEWELHHQGGAAGYEAREYLGTPSSEEVVSEGQAFAWNPSVTGVKSEDTVLIGAGGHETLTQIPGWPSIQVEIDGQVIPRPALLKVL